MPVKSRSQPLRIFELTLEIRPTSKHEDLSCVENFLTDRLGKTRAGWQLSRCAGGVKGSTTGTWAP